MFTFSRMTSVEEVVSPVQISREISRGAFLPPTVE
jgi:hypothetical protein